MNKQERKKYLRKQYLKNRVTILLQTKERYLKNKDKISQQHKIYRATHKKELKIYRIIHNSELKNYQKIYRKIHRLKLKDYYRIYRQTHKIEKKKWQHNKLKIDINYRMSHHLSNRIRAVLKGLNKSNLTIKLLGCNIEFFRNYYESKFTKGMSWTKVMNGEIHCDHIKPCASFDLSKPNEQRKCFHYTNLQPLWARDNLSKGDKINE